MKPKVMIVDDEEIFANTLVERLEIRDYNVTASYNGNDALAMLKKLNFDVVILDVAMPGMSGIETLREIKKIKPLTEVIMLTGHATVETAIEGMKLGAMDFLIKPCEAEELMRKINAAYDKKSKHEERIREARVKELISSPMSVFRKNK